MDTLQRQNAVLFSAFYNDCRGIVDADIISGSVLLDWFGVGSMRIRPLVELARDLGMAGAEATVHGMIAYAKEHAPMNQVPDSICQKIIRLFGELTRQSPEVYNKSGKVPAIACNPSINSLGKVIKEFAKENPEDAAKFTERTGINILQRYCIEHNLQFMQLKKDHNCCPVCIELTGKKNDYHSSAQKLENQNGGQKTAETRELRSLEVRADVSLEEHYRNSADFFVLFTD